MDGTPPIIQLTRRQLLQTENPMRPLWTYQWFLRTAALRELLVFYRTSVAKSRKLVPKPKAPKRIWIDHAEIPPRQDLLLENMTPAQAMSSTPVEWVQDPQSLETPRNHPAQRVILFLHGGGYYTCNPATHRTITWQLSHFCKARILSVNYRLAPENPFPLALHDALSAYSHLLAPADPGLPSYKPSQIIICGDSAGAGLAIATMLYIRDHPEHFALPAGVVGICPLLDLTSSMPSCQINKVWDYLPSFPVDPKWCGPNRHHVYIPDNSYLKHPYVSPIYALEDPCRPTCPLLIQVGEVELFRDENIYFVVKQFPHSPIRLEIYEDYTHDFHLLMKEKNTRHAYQRIAAFVEKTTSVKICPTTTHLWLHREDQGRVVKVLYRDNSVAVVTNPLQYIEDGSTLLKKYAAVAEADRASWRKSRLSKKNSCPSICW
ncbi:hypothetical protein SeMB42_g01791 [Synchytrium endobioticum]|uniref:Alpha/beta hydrolase fold-3 domain-containing protein n=1 Tax=Synchytrium endobioticum TaxID=286115 RepID=A0A507DKV8_9FUNG|nr:hypothetical protein SeLEV6574_g02932 [Synchytrium endobioticum]TPX51885.1 hypothetical protein SeMB42_g01791 [Synchytrium endobioticum]